jgi:hypothetical protein
LCPEYTFRSSIWFWILGLSLVVKISWCADSGRAAHYYAVQDIHHTSWSSGSMPTSKSRCPGFYSVLRFSAVYQSLHGYSVILSYALPFQFAIQNHCECTYKTLPFLLHSNSLTWMFVFICAVTTGWKIVDSRYWATQCCFHTVYF